MIEQDQSGAMQCFAEWLLCHDRGQEGLGTLAERALAEARLPPPVLQGLAARAAAPISLYRIEEVKRGEGVQLHGVLDGSRVFVHDRALSETAEKDLMLFAKVHRAGSFHFITMMSAPLAMDSERQLMWLEAQGLEVTAAGLARTPHLLGRLWSWRAERQRQPVRLTNTDGEPLVDIQVSFVAEDLAAVRKALQQRDDVHEFDDRFAWVGQGEDMVHQASLEFIGDELVATVNSEGRLERLRRWLRALPGLREQNVTRRPFSAAPADDRAGTASGSEPLPAEAVAAMREAMRTHYLHWIDEPIPALGRSLSDPVGPSGPIDGAVPRAEMLRELGLEGEAAG